MQAREGGAEVGTGGAGTGGHGHLYIPRWVFPPTLDSAREAQLGACACVCACVTRVKESLGNLGGTYVTGQDS